LRNGLSAAIAGHGRLFLLIGEPGIGKSGLADQISGDARRRGARVLVGRCWEAGGAPAYWPWVQSLREGVRDADTKTLRDQLGAGAADLAQLLPEVRERFPDLPQLPSVESEGARFRLFEAAAGFLMVLEALYGDDPGAHLAELAHHAIAGTDFEKGASYAERAGERALALLAYEEAARLYQKALEALELAAGGDQRRCELLLSLGDAYGRAGNTPVSQAVFLSAVAVAREVGLSRDLARAAAGYGGRIVWARAGEDDRLVPLLEEAIKVLGEEDLDLRARLSEALRDELSRTRRDAVSDEAVKLARRLSRPDTLAYALAGRGAAIIGPDLWRSASLSEPSSATSPPKSERQSQS
jgi:tetratricopeptide (TPR) repeat protein